MIETRNNIFRKKKDVKTFWTERKALLRSSESSLRINFNIKNFSLVWGKETNICWESLGYRQYLVSYTCPVTWHGTYLHVALQKISQVTLQLGNYVSLFRVIPFSFLSLVSPLVLIRESQSDLIPALGVSSVSRLSHFLYSESILYSGSQANPFGLILLKSVLSLRKTMPRNAETTKKLHSYHTLVK